MDKKTQALVEQYARSLVEVAFEQDAVSTTLFFALMTNPPMRFSSIFSTKRRVLISNFCETIAKSRAFCSSDKGLAEVTVTS